MILDDIIISKHNELARASYLYDIVKMLEQRRHIKAKSFYNTVKGNELSFIGEIKRGQPLLMGDCITVKDIDVSEALGIYKGNTQALSVITEKCIYKGRLEDLEMVRTVWDVPVISRDFVISPYQIFQAKIYGASAVLLVERILKPIELKEFIRLIEGLKMDPVVEVHNEKGLEIALKSGAKIISVNCVEYESFIQQTKRILDLSKMIPDDVLLLCDCMRYNNEDMDYIQESGANAVFVGTDIFKDKNININRFLSSRIKFSV